MKGTIIENSLSDKSLLQKAQIQRTWKSGSWTLHDVLIDEAFVSEVPRYIAEGPWYIHFWGSENDDIMVVFRDKIFRATKGDKGSFADAVAYGKTIGIPEEQLDFVTH